MVIPAYVLLIVAILFGVAGQILLKRGMLRHPGFRLQDVFQLVKDLSVVGGFACYAISTLLYVAALAELELSLAYPTVSLGYVLVILLSSKLFHEKVSLVRWSAVLIICAGVTLVGLGVR